MTDFAPPRCAKYPNCPCGWFGTISCAPEHKALVDKFAELSTIVRRRFEANFMAVTMDQPAKEEPSYHRQSIEILPGGRSLTFESLPFDHAALGPAKIPTAKEEVASEWTMMIDLDALKEGRPGALKFICQDCPVEVRHPGGRCPECADKLLDIACRASGYLFVCKECGKSIYSAVPSPAETCATCQFLSDPGLTEEDRERIRAILDGR